MYLKRSITVFAICNLLLVAACTSNSDTGRFFPVAGDNPFKVESVPPGAAVYVMGEKIGETPIMISHKDVFPNVYPHDKESVYGRITLKKEGCADLTRPVSAEISNGGLHAKLDCADNTPAAIAPRSAASVEQRLSQIKELQDKGLISDEEAKQARARVLKDL